MTLSRTLLAVAACVILAPSVCQAQSRPQVGQTAVDFELQAVNGELDGNVRLSDLTGQGPVVVVVLRGYPGYQCPVCSKQVNQLVGAGGAIAAKGAKVLMVYPGPAGELQSRADEFVHGNELPAPLTLLIDPDYQFVNAYDIRWDAPRETAYPSTFVIGSDGRFKMVRISEGHRGRTTPPEVLAAL